MILKPGKQFEADVKASALHQGIYHYRLKDAPGAWMQGGDQRQTFTTSNDYDLIAFWQGNFLALELKSIGATAFPFLGLRKNQTIGLSRAALHEGIRAGVLLNFRRYKNRTFFIPIGDVLTAKETCGRKSLGLSLAEKIGTEVGNKKLKVHHRYDLKDLIRQVGFYEPEEPHD